MAGNRHEGFAEMFERRPELVRALLGEAATILPRGAPVRVASNEFSHYKPTKYYADRVLVFGTPPHEVAVIVEIQRRFREEKRRVWPFYVSSLWAHLEEVVMKTVTPEYRSDYNRAIFAEGEAEGEARGEARGEAKGEARAIITVLESRGLTLSAAARARITTCTDLDQLDAWLHRVGTVQTVDALFG